MSVSFGTAAMRLSHLWRTPLTFGQVTRVDLHDVREVPRQVHLQLVGLLSECSHHLQKGKRNVAWGEEERGGGGGEKLLRHLNLW